MNKLALIVSIQEGKKAGRKERWGEKGRAVKRGEGRKGREGRKKERNSLMAL